MYFRTFAFRPRHPLARALAWIVGAIAVVALLAFGAFALVAFLIGGAVLLVVNALRAPRPAAASASPPPPPQPGVIEGEFTVLKDRPGAR